jgi:type II secretory pathway pseudopilin PulG
MSLAEALVSLAVVGACLVVMGGLFTSASRNLASQERKAQATEALQAACETLAQDIEEGIQGTCQQGAGKVVLTLQRVALPRVDASVLSAPAPSPGPPTAVTVTYAFDETTGTLTRQYGDSTATVVATGLAGLSCRVSGDTVEITASADTGAGGRWDEESKAYLSTERTTIRLTAWPRLRPMETP